MDQNAFNIGMVITLLAALISSGNMARAESAIETSAPLADSGVISGSVARSAFTLAVVNREPKEAITELSNDQHHVYFFTELKGMTGQNVIHRWSYNGQTMAEVKFNVGAPRWRVWSSKTLMSDWTGEWSVSVINELDEEVFSDSFEYVAVEATTSQ